MRLLTPNLSLFAYDPNKDKDTNYAAQMQAILDKGEKNLTTADYKNLAALEKAANEKVAYLDQTGTNKWGATQSSKYQDAYNSMTSNSSVRKSKSSDNAGSGAANIAKRVNETVNNVNNTLASKYDNTNYAAQMQAILDKGNLTGADYKALADLEKAANEKIAYLDQTGTNKWGATQSTKYQDAYNSMASLGLLNGSAAYTPIDPSGIDWDKKMMSSKDYDLLASYGKAWNAAKAAGDQKAMDHYHDLAEQLRASYSYSGGADGSQYLPIEKPPIQEMSYEDILAAMLGTVGPAPEYGTGTNGSIDGLLNNFMAAAPTYTAQDSAMPTFNPNDYGAAPTFNAQAVGAAPTFNAQAVGAAPTFNAQAVGATPVFNAQDYVAPEFNSRWDDTKNQLAQAYLDMNYEDFLGSEQYRDLANRYGDAGRTAMQDALGQVASRTGGLASSYSQQVAQQQYNNYMSQLSQAAYDMYAGELQSAYNKAQAAYAYDNDDYARYQDELAQWNRNYDRDYAMYQDELAQWNRNYDRNYSMYQDELAQWNRNYDRDYAMYQDELSQWNRNYDRNYSMYQDELAQWNRDYDRGYSRYQDELAQWNANNDRAYGIYQDELTQWNKDRSYAADAMAQALAQSNYNQEWSYKVSQANKADAMDRIDAYLAAGGTVTNLDPSLIAASGYTSAELLQLQNYYQGQNYAGGGNVSSKTARASSPTKQQTTQTASAAYKNPGENVMAVLDNAYSAGDWASAKAFLNYATNTLGLTAEQVEAWNNRRRVE